MLKKDTTKPETAPVVSATAYARILTAPRLQRMLLPEGLFPSPYEVLDYRATLTLEDPEGVRATFRRTERIRFQQDRVAAILDHAWGDGILMTSYANQTGHLEESFSDEGRRHFVIALKRRMRRGDILAFRVERTAMVGFTRDEEWLETTIDHPVARLERRIVFPAERPCRRATLHVAGRKLPLPVHRVRGQTMVQVVIAQPRAHVPYTIRWTW